MISARRITLLVGLILAHLFIVGCGCGKKKNRDVLANEERRLKNNIKQQCKPEEWKKFEGIFDQDKNDAVKIGQHIQRLSDLQPKINKLVGAIQKIMADAAKGNGKNITPQTVMATMMQCLDQPVLDFLSPLKIMPEALSNKKASDLFANFSKNPNAGQAFIPLVANPALLELLPSFANNQIALWRLFGKQLGRKSAEGTGTE